jgi:cellulose/xylan binding protein with CBM9 domain
MSKMLTTLLVCLLLFGGCAQVGCGQMKSMVSVERKAITGSATEADPVQIPKASGEMTIDGDLSDWAAVGPMPMPFMDMKLSSAHFCWGPAGLYCAVAVTDDMVDTDPDAPWSADGLEIWLQKDGVREDDATEFSAQYAFAPDTESAKGECFVVIPYGGEMDLEEDVHCAWKKTETGYIMEILIPVEMLKPAEMKAGTKIGLSFALENDGIAVEQFVSDKDEDAGYRTPSSWGVAVLAE